MTEPVKAKVDRRTDAKQTLQGPDLSPGKFIELCWAIPEIEKVDIYRVKNTGTSKLEQFFQRDYPPDDVESFLLHTLGAGRYQLSPKSGPDGRYVISRTWGMGEYKDEPVAPAVAIPKETVAPASASIDTAQINKAIMDEIKSMGFLHEWQQTIQSSKDAQATREMKPMEIMANMLTALIAAKKDSGDDATTRLVLEEMRDLKRKIEALEKRPAVPASSNDVGDIAGQIQKIISVAGVLGLTKVEGGVAAVPQESWSDGLAKIIKEAAPFIKDVLDVVKERVALGPASNPTAVPALGTGDKPMALAQLSEEDKEQVGVLVGALESRDFETVYYVVASYFGIPVNPKVSPAAYMPSLKKLDPRFGPLQSHVTEFLKWLGERQAAEKPSE